VNKNSVSSRKCEPRNDLDGLRKASISATRNVQRVAVSIVLVRPLEVDTARIFFRKLFRVECILN
jgi:hypothetical protein